MNAIKEARYNLAIAYLNDAQYNEAIPEFQAVIDLDADFIDAHCGLSRAYLELNELDKAEKSAKTALDLNSDYPSARSLIDELVNVHYENGITLLNDKRYREAVSMFEKVAALDPNYKHINYNLGRSHIGLRQYDKAITSLQSAIDTDSSLEDVHYHIGCAYIEQRQFDTAIQHLEQAINTDPNLKDAHYHLACAYREIGNLEAATNAVTETLRLDPNYQPVHELVEKIKQTHYNKGISYLNNNRYSDAIAAFQNVITLDADFTAAHYNLGVANLKLENFARAVDVLQTTINLDRTHKAAFHALALAYFGLHELENARNAAKDALEIDPNYQPAKSLLEAIDPNFTDIPIPDTSESQDTSTEQQTDIVTPKPTEDIQQEDESEVQSTVEDADTPVQDKSEIQKDLDRGLIFLSNRQYNNAAAAYKNAIKADPICIEAHYGLGQTYLEMGALDDAKSAAEEALKLDPRHQPAQELIQAVKYLVNLEKNRKIRKKVLIYASLVLIFAFGAYAALRFELISFQKPVPKPNDNDKQLNSKNRDNSNDNKNVKENTKPIPHKLSLGSTPDWAKRETIIYTGETGQLKLRIRNTGGPIHHFKIKLGTKPIQGLEVMVPIHSFKLNGNKTIAEDIKIRVAKSVSPKTIILPIQLTDKNDDLIVSEDYKLKIKLRPDPVEIENGDNNGR